MIIRASINNRGKKIPTAQYPWHNTGAIKCCLEHNHLLRFFTPILLKLLTVDPEGKWYRWEYNTGTSKFSWWPHAQKEQVKLLLVVFYLIYPKQYLLACNQYKNLNDILYLFCMEFSKSTCTPACTSDLLRIHGSESQESAFLIISQGILTIRHV